MTEVTIAGGIQGNRGTNPDAFQRALDIGIDAVAYDGGSLDPGPYYLGAGHGHHPRSTVKHDLETIVPPASERGIPVLIGSAGGIGAEPHLNWNLEILEEVATERSLDLDVAVIASDVSPDTLKRWKESRIVTPVDHGQPLSTADVDDSDEIVAQMGIEPLVEALEADPDVVMAGRSCDNAVVAAYPFSQGLPKGLALHMGNILECAELAAEVKPGESIDTDQHPRIPMLGRIDEEGFTVWPSDDRMRCTEVSIAGHSLYEESHPYQSQEPGGVLDTSECTYESVDEESVRVTGSSFVDDDQYTVKLEGAGTIGYRTISIFGIRDPTMIEQLDDILDELEAVLVEEYQNQGIPVEIAFRVYGRDGTMAALEPQTGTSHEVGVLAEVVSDTQDNAEEICEKLFSRVAFWRYADRVTTAGNVATPFAPRALNIGPMIDLTVHHAVTLDEPTSPFDRRHVHFPR